MSFFPLTLFHSKPKLITKAVTAALIGKINAVVIASSYASNALGSSFGGTTSSTRVAPAPTTSAAGTCGTRAVSSLTSLLLKMFCAADTLMAPPKLLVNIAIASVRLVS